MLLGRFECAEDAFRESLAERSEPFGDHPQTAYSLQSLAIALEKQGWLEATEPIYCEGLAILRRALPDGHSMTTSPMVAPGDLLGRTGPAAEGERLLREALEARIESGDSPAAVAARARLEALEAR